MTELARLRREVQLELKERTGPEAGEVALHTRQAAGKEGRLRGYWSALESHTGSSRGALRMRWDAGHDPSASAGALDLGAFG